MINLSDVVVYKIATLTRKYVEGYSIRLQKGSVGLS